MILQLGRQDYWREFNERDEDTLVLTFFLHIYPCTFCNCKYMWRVFIPSFVAVLLDDGIGIEWQVLVRINGD